MTENKLKITFHNPNTEDATENFITKLTAELILKKLEHSPSPDEGIGRQQAG